MISCLDLEREGRWRAASLASIGLLVSIPTLVLLSHGLGAAPPIGSAWGSALRASLWLAFGTSGLSLLIGAPLGCAAALYVFPARNVLLTLAALPLLVPSLLLALGWSSLSLASGFPPPGWLEGANGCLLSFSAQGGALVLIATLATASAIPESQREAARLFGGEPALFGHTLRASLAPAVLAALLAGVLTLSDPAPGQIFSQRTAAGAILESFAARGDLAEASRQCALLALVALALAAPVVVASLRGVGAPVLSRVPRRGSLRMVAGPSASTALALLGMAALLAVPVLGLTLPLARDLSLFASGALGPALRRAGETALDSLGYALGAATLATGLALCLAAAAGRSPRLRGATLALAVLQLAIPVAAPALGLASIAASAPEWADPALRGPAAVWLALGLRFLPVAALLLLRAWSTTAPSWFEAAALHGVSLVAFARRVLFPALARGLAASVVVVALLAASDVVAILLLHPPGRPSLALAIFTIMANARESAVAALCLVYLIAAGVIGATLAVGARAVRRT